MTGCGSLHVCAYFDQNGNLRNTYLSKGSTGGCNNFMVGLSRLISLSARNGVSVHDIVDQLGSCGSCPSYAVRRATKHDTSPGACCPSAVGNALLDMWKEVNERDFGGLDHGDAASGVRDCNSSDGLLSDSSGKIQFEKEKTEVSQCPECGTELNHEMGCVTCPNCGYSKCG